MDSLLNVQLDPTAQWYFGLAVTETWGDFIHYNMVADQIEMTIPTGKH